MPALAKSPPTAFGNAFPLRAPRVNFGPLNVRVANPCEEANWDQQVLAFPDCTIFHGQAWARVLQETYGLTPRYLVARDDRRTRGVLPLMETSHPWSGRRGVSLPFSDHVPLLGDNADAVGGLLRRAYALGRERQWKTIEFRGEVADGMNGLKGSPAGADPAVPDEFMASLSYHHHTLDLRRPESDLLEAMDASARRALRKAERCGLEIKFCRSPEGMKKYYHLHCLTRRRQGLPPQPWRFFQVLQERILAAGAGDIGLANIEGKCVAGAVFLHFGPRVFYKFGASDRAYQSYRANNLIMAMAIQHYAREGFAGLDFGRTAMDNEGLRRFKRSLGAEETTLRYCKYDLVRNRYIREKELTLGWHNLIFRWMPIWASRMVGNMVYKHFA